MKRVGIVLLILIGLLSFTLSVREVAADRSARGKISPAVMTATPTLQTFPSFERDDPQTKAVIALIQAYFEARYRAFSTLRLEGFESLLSGSPEASDFWEKEAKKLSVDLNHAALNRLRYVTYDFSLDYLSVEIDPERATGNRCSGGERCRGL